MEIFTNRDKIILYQFNIQLFLFNYVCNSSMYFGKNTNSQIKKIKYIAQKGEKNSTVSYPKKRVRHTFAFIDINSIF